MIKPVNTCQRGSETYGEGCVNCGDCGRTFSANGYPKGRNMYHEKIATRYKIQCDRIENTSIAWNEVEIYDIKTCCILTDKGNKEFIFQGSKPATLRKVAALLEYVADLAEFGEGARKIDVAMAEILK